MKKNILLIIAILFAFTANSQTQNYDTINFEDVGCIKYKYKTISVENEKNKALFYNNKEDENFVNFADLIIKSVKEYGVTAYESENLQVSISAKYVLEQMGEHTDTIYTEDRNGEIKKKIEKTEYNPNDIIAYNIKELCIYDKLNNLIHSRIEAICPVIEHEGYDGEGLRIRSTFWIYFDELSSVLEKYNSFENETFFAFFYNKKYEASFDSKFYPYGKEEIFVNLQKYEQNYNHIFKYPEQKKMCPVSHFDSIYTKDIMYAEYKYRKLDTLELENYALFFPKLEDEESNSYKNLIEVLMYAIENEGLTVYKPNYSFTESGNIFEEPTILYDVEKNLGKEKEEMEMWDEEYYETYGEYPIYIIETPCDLDAVNQYIIQELWLYNYDNEPIDVKTVGIAPIRTFFRPDDIDEEDPRYKIVFWAYYPEFQKTASKYNVLPTDCQTHKTFDQILFNHKYKSVEDLYRVNEIYNSDTTIFDTIPCIVNMEANKSFYENLGIVFSEKEENIDNKKQKKAKYTETVYTKIEKNDENKILFFPEQPAYGYKSLIDHIMYVFENKDINFYKSENLEKVITNEEAKAQLGERVIKQFIYDDYGNEKEIEILDNYKSEEITSYLTKEIWHYRGKKIVKKEIIAICPIREYYRDTDPDKLEPLYSKMFWIDYKELEEKFKNINISKLKPEADQTIPSYFKERKYKSEIIEDEK